jgi:antitoxin (DNA-binding transcriptional repressor) of toxin-antitoxin stability system
VKAVDGKNDHGHFVLWVCVLIGRSDAGKCFQSQFKAHMLEYFRMVEKTGEPLIITDHGKPTLEIRRVGAKGVDELKALKGSVLWYERPFDPVDEDQWEALQ